MNRITKYQTFILIALCALIISGCADVQPNIQPYLQGHQYGFWGGFWHGTIAFFSFIGSLFDKDIAVWAVNNNGNFYTLGFLLGAGVFGGFFKILKGSSK
jgi:hypothetical protein